MPFRFFTVRLKNIPNPGKQCETAFIKNVQQICPVKACEKLRKTGLKAKHSVEVREAMYFDNMIFCIFPCKSRCISEMVWTGHQNIGALH